MVMYPEAGFPTVILTEDGQQVTVRLMHPNDKDALLAFFHRIPEEDLIYLKDDVTAPEVIEGWTSHVDYRRVVPLVAVVGDRIVADATLHRRRPLARRHVGEVRIVVDPEYRNLGLGRGLLRLLTELAADKGIERLLLELVINEEEAAQHAARLIGFEPIAILINHAKDLKGVPKDVYLMELDVAAKARPGTPESVWTGAR